MKLVGILSSEREGGIFRRLRVDLEILAQAHFQRQLRQCAERILHVESVVRHGERKSRVPRSLTEIDVFPQRKSFQIRKFIKAERRPEIGGFVRIRAAVIGVRIPGAVKIETELQRMFADHVINAVG